MSLIHAIRTVVAGRAGGASLSVVAGEVLANRTPHNQAGQKVTLGVGASTARRSLHVVQGARARSNS